MNRNNSEHMMFIYGIFVFSLLPFIVVPTSCFGRNDPCEILRADLAQQNLRLIEYMKTVKKLDDRDDSEIIQAIYSKVVELRRRISKLEKELHECEDSKDDKGVAAPDGLGPVQSEEGENATKTCGELRKKLMVLVKNLHHLRRRESSLLSQLTDAEKKELQETATELKTVREALRNRCSARPNSKVSRQAPKGPKN